MKILLSKESWLEHYICLTYVIVPTSLLLIHQKNNNLQNGSFWGHILYYFVLIFNLKINSNATQYHSCQMCISTCFVGLYVWIPTPVFVCNILFKKLNFTPGNMKGTWKFLKGLGDENSHGGHDMPPLSNFCMF